MAFGSDNPAMKLKKPMFLKGAKGAKPAAKPAKTAAKDDPLGLMDEEDKADGGADEAEEGDASTDDLFGDAGQDTDFDPEMKLGEASLEQLRTALASKEKEQEASDQADSSKDDKSDSGDSSLY